MIIEMEVYDLDRFLILRNLNSKYIENCSKKEFLSQYFEKLITQEHIIYLIINANFDVGYIWLDIGKSKEIESYCISSYSYQKFAQNLKELKEKYNIK